MPGIIQMGFSVYKAHLKEIDLGSVLNAITATLESGIQNISLSISYQTKREFQILKHLFEKRFPGIAVAGWPILPIGRAREHLEMCAGSSRVSMGPPAAQLRRTTPA